MTYLEIPICLPSQTFDIIQEFVYKTMYKVLYPSLHLHFHPV